MLRVVFVVAVVIVCSPARAMETTMPINFIGEWCLTSRVDTVTSYALPGWIENKGCTKILTIQQNNFFFEGRHCEPVKMRLRRDIGPTGIGYTATITARCQPDGPLTGGTLETFEFNRNQGNLMVTTK